MVWSSSVYQSQQAAVLGSTLRHSPGCCLKAGCFQPLFVMFMCGRSHPTEEWHSLINSSTTWLESGLYLGAPFMYVVTCISCHRRALCGYPSVYITDAGRVHALGNSLSSSVCKYLLVLFTSVLHCKITLALYLTEIPLGAEISQLTDSTGSTCRLIVFEPQLPDPSEALTSGPTKGPEPIKAYC